MKKVLIAAKALIVATSFSLLCQCSSTQFTGVTPSPPVKKLAIVKNDKILMDYFEPAILKQVNQMGIAASLVDSPPPGNEAYLTYTANWKWDMVMYLWYFKADLHCGQSIIGSVEYQASGVDMNKFGNVDDKVGPMLKKLIVGE